jgi:hypothetical protein
MKKKSELPAERRVLKLKRETVRLLDLKAADLKTVAGGIIFMTRPTVGCGC